MREQNGEGQAPEDKEVGPKQRVRARVEDTRRQANSLVLWRGGRHCAWRGRGDRGKVADGGDRDFDGPEAVRRNVMDDDAQIGFAFDRSRDFEVIADGRLEEGLVVFGRKIELDGIADSVEEEAFG